MYCDFLVRLSLSYTLFLIRTARFLFPHCVYNSFYLSIPHMIRRMNTVTLSLPI